MIRAVESESEIKECQKKLEETLNSIVDRTENRPFSRRGGREKNITISISSSKNIWFSLGNISEGKRTGEKHYWNVFGTVNNPSSLRVQFNIPVIGNRKRFSGLFGKDDDTGLIYLLHRGKIGGGIKGVGKKSFDAKYLDIKETIYDRKGTSECYVIGCLTDIDFIDKLVDFINSVKDIKKSFKTPPRHSVFLTLP